MMDFNGKWQIYEQDNHEEFLKEMAVPEMLVRMMKDVKPVTEIEQKGDVFTIKIQTSVRTLTNTFTVGTQSEITTLDGSKHKVTAKVQDGKLVCNTDKFTHTREMQGDSMVETLSAGATTMTRKSRRI